MARSFFKSSCSFTINGQSSLLRPLWSRFIVFIVFLSLTWDSITDFSVKSSTYSHSWHINQSVSVHSSASSRVMRSSSLQPQQDTITSSVITRLLSIGWIISLVLSLITGNSIAQSPQKSTLNFTFFYFFLASYCDSVSRLRGPASADGIAGLL